MKEAERYLGVPYIYGGNNPAKGIDCSAYISLIWGIPRQSTDTIHGYSYEIADDDIRPGDALNLPYVGRKSHIRLFAGWASDDRTAAWIYEAARGRGVNYRPIAYDVRYTPIRRNRFVADVPMPEPALPPDYDVSGGRFFSQMGSRDGIMGFAVTNDDAGRMWDAFRLLGGIESIGYPVSRRFDADGVLAQATEKATILLHPDGPMAIATSAGLTPRPDADARAPERSPLLKRVG